MKLYSRRIQKKCALKHKLQILLELDLGLVRTVLVLATTETKMVIERILVMYYGYCSDYKRALVDVIAKIEGIICKMNIGVQNLNQRIAFTCG